MKKLKVKCDKIQRKIEDLGEKIKNRPNSLMATIRDMMTTMSLKNPNKLIQNYKTRDPLRDPQDHSDGGRDSDSSV